MADAYPWLRVFRRASNSGGVEVWNETAAQVRGGYIAFCAAADRFLLEHLEASDTTYNQFAHLHSQASWSVHMGSV